MSALSLNEIKQNAIQFARKWEDAKDERAEAQTFWNEFFRVLGLERRTIAAFEKRVKSIKSTYHRIDVFLPGKLLIEHKSSSEALDKAEAQAFEYIEDLIREGRHNEIPRYVLLCNFRTFVLFDLEPEGKSERPLWKEKPYERIEFPLHDLHEHIKHFFFLIGRKTHKLAEEDPANLEAAQIMADLHDEVEKVGYTRIDMERLLVRLLFCLFADDTGIFDPSQFELYVENKTQENGSNLGQELNALFDVLNTPTEKRPKLLDEDLAAFPYINGELFNERLGLAAFNRDMRNRLMAACHFDWSRISPAIFGSLFQGILDTKERRQIGAHYTSERDIMKVIRPLFLDELQEEFEKLKNSRSTRRKVDLQKFQDKLASLKFLDPACGCGNFLVISYRELRKLELEVLKLIYNFDKREKEFEFGELSKLSKVDVNQFYGIEILPWPTRIAETALWLTDHQMNTELTKATGNSFQRIPLKASPHILCANALRMDWNKLLPAKDCSYVLGNPPFVGKRFQSNEQKSDLTLVFGKGARLGALDYVTCWYAKACGYTDGTKINSAFVSTNSICQGEQVNIFWGYLLQGFNVQIKFAHRTFSWQSEAKGAAHVHVVIIGFGRTNDQIKHIYEYEKNNAEPHRVEVSRINPYLIEASDVLIATRSKPISQSPDLSFGSMANDGGNLILNQDEMNYFAEKYPDTKSIIRPYLGAIEFINNLDRYCFWLEGSSPDILKKIPELMQRIEDTRKVRINSSRHETRKLANLPTLFAEIRQPLSKYLAIPKTSSERRTYIPIGFLEPHVIANTELFTIPDATLFHFGVLTSAMHMDWMRQVCGRLKSDFRYSAKLVYNNFPWPDSPTAAQQTKVEQCAQTVLDVRDKYLKQNSTLANLYDPLIMPGDLLKAHQALDKAVDQCYRKEKFNSERERVEHLFGLYEKLTAPLAMSEQVKRKRGRGKQSN